MKAIILSILILLFGTTYCSAQDMHFSQFYDAPLYRNPALAGIFTGDIHVQALYRNQWSSVTNPYQTGYLSAEYKLPIGHQNDFITVGGEMSYDKAGSAGLTTTRFYPAFNYHKSLNKARDMYLSAGFMGGFTQRRIDRTKVTTDNEYDNPGSYDGEVLANNNITYWDGAAGLSFNMALDPENKNHMYFGVGYHHFNAPKSSFYSNQNIQVDPKVVVSGGVRMNISDMNYITFHADYMKQGPYHETIFGGLYSWKFGPDFANPLYIFSAGAFVRWQSDFVPTIKMDYMPWAITLSYDANTSSLKTASQGRGGFELGISYIGFLNTTNSTKNAIPCPKF